MPNKTRRKTKSFFNNKKSQNAKTTPKNRIVVYSTYDWRNDHKYEGFDDDMNAIRNRFDRTYIDNLINFIKKDFIVVVEDETLTFSNDIEIEYILAFSNDGMKLYYTERGSIRNYIIENSKSVKYVQAKLVQFLSKQFNTSSVSPVYSKLDTNNIEDVKKIIHKNIDSKYYSFEKEEVGKINVDTNEDGSITIYYCTKTLEKKYFYKNLNEDYKFRVLYRIIEHLKESTLFILQFEETFKIKLSSQEKKDLIIL